MRKKIVIIGLVLIVAAFIASFLLSYINPFMYMNTTISGNGFFSINFSMPSNTSSALFMFAGRFNKSINFYSFNLTAFQKWKALVGANPANGLSYAKALEGNGTLAILTNVTSIALPAEHNITNATLVYSSNRSVSNETEVFVMQGISGITNASIAYIPPVTASTLSKYPSISNAIYYMGLGSLSAIVLFIVGLGMIIYGLIKKPKLPAAQKQSIDELKERDLLYSKLSKNEGPKAAKKPAANAHAKPHAKSNAKPKQEEN